MLLGVYLLTVDPPDVVEHDALGVVDHRGRVLGTGLVVLVAAHQLLPQHLPLLLLLLDLLGLLGVLVQFYDPNYPHQLHYPHRPRGRPRGLRLRGQLGQRGAVLSAEDLVAEEVDVEDDGCGRDDIEEEEKGEEVVVDEARTQYDLQGEHPQNDQPDHVVEDVDRRIEERRPEIIKEKRIHRQHRDQHLVFQTA